MITIKSSDYKGKKLDDVVSQLASMGLSVHSEGKSSSEEKNSVLEVSPEGEVAAGSNVTVVYSTGPESVTLPNKMVGQDAQTVIDEITQLGVNVTRHDENSSEQSADKVIRTSPSEGNKVTVGSNVDVYVSKGSGKTSSSAPAPENPSQEPSTTTPTPQPSEPSAPSTGSPQAAPSAAPENDHRDEPSGDGTQGSNE